MTSIAVIGSGNIGGNLARSWAARGHDITLGVRDAAKRAVVQLAQEIGASAASFDDAVTRSEVVAFAIPGGAMADTVAQLGARLDAKVVIDATNNMRGEHAHSRDAIASAAPAAAYVRASNTYGWEMIDEPVVGGVQADAFYCGPDRSVRAIVEQLISDAGLRPVRVGDADQVEVVDGLLRLWFAFVRHGHSRRLAFKTLEE